MFYKLGTQTALEDLGIWKVAAHDPGSIATPLAGAVHPGLAALIGGGTAPEGKGFSTGASSGVGSSLGMLGGSLGGAAIGGLSGAGLAKLIEALGGDADTGDWAGGGAGLGALLGGMGGGAYGAHRGRKSALGEVKEGQNPPAQPPQKQPTPPPKQPPAPPKRPPPIMGRGQAKTLRNEGVFL